MAEKKFYWLKLKEDFFRDKRIKKLRKIAGGDTYTIIYLKLQLLSLQNNGVIIFEGIENTLAEEIALDLDEDVDNVRITLNFLQTNGLFEETDQNHFIMTETIQCIGSESSSAERVRKHRDRLKALQCNSKVTNCNIEKEIDKDKDKDIEYIKENNVKEKRFAKPTLQEVIDYCEEKRNGVDPEKWYNYYESNGWKVGKNSMKNWKACVNTWSRTSFNKNKQEDNNFKEYADEEIVGLI